MTPPRHVVWVPCVSCGFQGRGRHLGWRVGRLPVLSCGSPRVATPGWLGAAGPGPLEVASEGRPARTWWELGQRATVVPGFASVCFCYIHANGREGAWGGTTPLSHLGTTPLRSGGISPVLPSSSPWVPLPVHFHTPHRGLGCQKSATRPPFARPSTPRWLCARALCRHCGRYDPARPVLHSAADWVMYLHLHANAVAGQATYAAASS